MERPVHADFPFPLNVFVHVLVAEEGEARALHYGLFSNPHERMDHAQDRSTRLVLGALPATPASVLDVGIGLGATLALLRASGYDAEGVTPDPSQLSRARERYGESFPVHVTTFEEYRPERAWDAVLFQESSQYIESAALFARASEMTRHVVVLDEFATRPLNVSGALRTREQFLEAAQSYGFEVLEETDLSVQAAPTVDWFIERLPRYRDRLVGELCIEPGKFDDLVESGQAYRSRYASGDYVYRLIRLLRN